MFHMFPHVLSSFFLLILPSSLPLITSAWFWPDDDIFSDGDDDDDDDSGRSCWLKSSKKLLLMYQKKGCKGGREDELAQELHPSNDVSSFSHSLLNNSFHFTFLSFSFSSLIPSAIHFLMLSLQILLFQTVKDRPIIIIIVILIFLLFSDCFFNSSDAAADDDDHFHFCFLLFLFLFFILSFLYHHPLCIILFLILFYAHRSVLKSEHLGFSSDSAALLSFSLMLQLKSQESPLETRTRESAPVTYLCQMNSFFSFGTLDHSFFPFLFLIPLLFLYLSSFPCFLSILLEFSSFILKNEFFLLLQPSTRISKLRDGNNQM